MKMKRISTFLALLFLAAVDQSPLIGEGIAARSFGITVESDAKTGTVFAFSGELVHLQWKWPVDLIDRDGSEFLVDTYRVLSTTVVPLDQKIPLGNPEWSTEEEFFFVEHKLELPESSGVQKLLVKLWNEKDGSLTRLSVVSLSAVSPGILRFFERRSVGWVSVPEVKESPHEFLKENSIEVVFYPTYEDSIDADLVFVEVDSRETLEKLRASERHPHRAVFLVQLGSNGSEIESDDLPFPKLFEFGSKQVLMLNRGQADLDSLSPEETYLLDQLLEDGK